MLILGRTVGERVAIGPPEKPMGFVSIESIKGGRVQLGFHFGPEIKVNRQEIAQRILEGQERTKTD